MMAAVWVPSGLSVTSAETVALGYTEYVGRAVPASVTRKQYVVPLTALVDATILYSSSTKFVDESVSVPDWDVVSSSPPFGVKNVVASFVVPPFATAISVVLDPLRKKVELERLDESSNSETVITTEDLDNAEEVSLIESLPIRTYNEDNDIIELDNTEEKKQDIVDAIDVKSKKRVLSSMKG